MDVLLLAVFNQVVALENGVTLDLVGSGDNASAVNDSLELGCCQYNYSYNLANHGRTNVRDSVVGDTDGASLALGELGHGYMKENGVSKLSAEGIR